MDLRHKGEDDGVWLFVLASWQSLSVARQALRVSAAQFVNHWSADEQGSSRDGRRGGCADEDKEVPTSLNNPTTICVSAALFFSMARFQSMPKVWAKNLGRGKEFRNSRHKLSECKN